MNPDDALMERVRDGDAAAFEQLFRKYERRLLNFFHKVCFSQTLAEDLTQEVFVRLWSSRRSYKPQGKFTTYLFRIAKNCWSSLSGSRRRRYEERRAELADGLVSEPMSDPAARAEDAELRRRLRAAVASLPDELRIPFVLSRYGELNYADIAEVLSVSLRTVERRVTEAARLLATRLLGERPR